MENTKLGKPHKIELPEAYWNYILNALAQCPYKDVQAIIESIQMQGDGVQHGDNDSSGGEDLQPGKE